MSQNQPRFGPLESMLGLLGAGVLGVIAFVLLVVILSPVLLAVVIWMAIIRWRMKKAMREMASRVQAQWGPGTPEAPAPRKKIHVRVSEPED